MLITGLAAFAAPLPSGSASAFQEAPERPGNVLMVQGLLTDAAGAMASAAHLQGGDTVALKLPEVDVRWLFEAPVVARLQAAGITVVTGGEGVTTRIDIGMAAAEVRYGEMFHDGLFGAKRVERAARITLSGTIGRARELLWSGTIDTLRRDTIDADDIARLENGAPSALRDAPPDETFFDRILEPFVILGATGAAVYLLFHVRSS
jgi:hypothetical protein